MGGALRKPRRAGSRAGGRGGSTPTPVLVDEKYTKPCGLYVHKSIDMQRLRKLILAGRLAPCFTGLEEPADGVLLEECPICMLVRAVRHTEPGCQQRATPEATACLVLPKQLGRGASWSECPCVLVATPGRVCARCLRWGWRCCRWESGTVVCCPLPTHSRARLRPCLSAQYYPALNRSKCCNKSLCTGAQATRAPWNGDLLGVPLQYLAAPAPHPASLALQATSPDTGHDDACALCCLGGAGVKRRV